MGKKSAIRRRLRSVQNRFKAAKSDSYLSDIELLNIVNAVSKIKALEPIGRQLKKTDRILSKATKWFSMTNTTEVVNEIVKEVEVIKEVEVPGETVYVDREVVREVPAPYFADTIEQSFTTDHQGVWFTMELCDNPAIDFFKENDWVSLEVRATNFALDEIVNWSDFTTETDPSGPNNLGIDIFGTSLLELDCLRGVDNSHLGWEYIDDDFLDMPRTFAVYVNETQQRQIAIEIEDLVGPMDSVA